MRGRKVIAQTLETVYEHKKHRREKEHDTFPKLGAETKNLANGAGPKATGSISEGKGTNRNASRKIRVQLPTWRDCRHQCLERRGENELLHSAALDKRNVQNIDGHFAMFDACACT